MGVPLPETTTPFEGVVVVFPGRGMFLFADPGAIFAGGAATGRAGVAFEGFAAAFAGCFAAGFADFESLFRAGAGFFFFAAVGIGSDLSSKMRGAASGRAC
jgi:hypothetical protein